MRNVCVYVQDRVILHTWRSRVNERSELAIQIVASCDGDDIFHVCHCHIKIWHSHCHVCLRKGREVFYLTTHSTHFIYGYMVSGIW